MKKILVISFIVFTNCAVATMLPYAIEENNKKNTSIIKKYIERPYEINGKWFYPKDYKYFEEIGIANVENKLKNGDETTIKEYFHSEVFSGSHRSLPLPSIVKVLNLENGLSVNVRINQRGSYSSTEIIDLSSSVFKELEINKENALVKIQLVSSNESFVLSKTRTFEEEKKIKEAPIANVIIIAGSKVNNNEIKDEKHNKIEKIQNKQYEKLYLCIATFSFKKNADNIAKELNEYKTTVKGIKENKKNVYKVLIGPYKNIDSLIMDLNDDIFNKYEDLSVYII